MATGNEELSLVWVQATPTLGGRIWERCLWLGLYQESPSWRVSASRQGVVRLTSGYLGGGGTCVDRLLTTAVVNHADKVHSVSPLGAGMHIIGLDDLSPLSGGFWTRLL